MDRLEAQGRVPHRAGVPLRRRPGVRASPDGRCRAARAARPGQLTRACGGGCSLVALLLMNALSDTQRAILALIAERISEEGMPPSQAEIARAMGFSSVRAAQY